MLSLVTKDFQKYTFRTKMHLAKFQISKTVVHCLEIYNCLLFLSFSLFPPSLRLVKFQ